MRRSVFPLLCYQDRRKIGLRNAVCEYVSQNDVIVRVHNHSWSCKQKINRGKKMVTYAAYLNSL